MALKYHTASRPGRLRTLITIEHQTTKPSELDGTPGVWAPYSQLCADVTPIRGQETATGQQMVPILGYQIVVRHDSGITSDMRAIVGSKTLYFASVIDVEERGRWTVIDARERTNG